MKTKIIYMMFAILGLLFSCSPKMQPFSAEVNFLYKETSGTIAVKSTGYGNNQNSAVQNAQINAFKVILFKGIPGTELNVPVIENESEAMAKNSDYFIKFFDHGGYSAFMMSSTVSSNLIKDKKTKKISVDVKINYNSLRKELEQNNIIRKFGF